MKRNTHTLWKLHGTSETTKKNARNEQTDTNIVDKFFFSLHFWFKYMNVILSVYARSQNEQTNKKLNCVNRQSKRRASAYTQITQIFNFLLEKCRLSFNQTGHMQQQQQDDDRAKKIERILFKTIHSLSVGCPPLDLSKFKTLRDRCRDRSA